MRKKPICEFIRCCSFVNANEFYNVHSYRGLSFKDSLSFSSFLCIDSPFFYTSPLSPCPVDCSFALPGSFCDPLMILWYLYLCGYFSTQRRTSANSTPSPYSHFMCLLIGVSSFPRMVRIKCINGEGKGRTQPSAEGILRDRTNDTSHCRTFQYIYKKSLVG